MKEKASKKEWLIVAVAFVGALFVIKPGFNMALGPALMGTLGGFGAGVAYTFVRKLGKNGVRGPIIVMFFSTFSTLVCLPFFLMSYQPMTWKQLLFLLGAGLAATGGQLSITAAYTYAPAKEISVYDYTQVIFAAIWGFFFRTGSGCNQYRWLCDHYWCGGLQEICEIKNAAYAAFSPSEWNYDKH